MIEENEQPKVDVTANLFFVETVFDAETDFYLAKVTCLQGEYLFKTGSKERVIAEIYAAGYAFSMIQNNDIDATIYISPELKKYLSLNNGSDALSRAVEYYLRLLWGGLMNYRRYYFIGYDHRTNEPIEQPINRVKIALYETEEMKKIWSINFHGRKLKQDEQSKHRETIFAV